MADQTRQRTYKQRVTRSECGKEFYSDYVDNHGKKHQGVHRTLSAITRQFYIFSFIWSFRFAVSYNSSVCEA